MLAAILLELLVAVDDDDGAAAPLAAPLAMLPGPLAVLSAADGAVAEAEPANGGLLGPAVGAPAPCPPPPPEAEADDDPTPCWLPAALPVVIF